MLDWLLVTFCAALLIDVDSLNSFFDVFTPLYAVAIIALLIYLRLQGGEANTVTK
jgi:cytosine/uracil/thiamine/allantoin permease